MISRPSRRFLASATCFLGIAFLAGQAQPPVFKKIEEVKKADAKKTEPAKALADQIDLLIEGSLVAKDPADKVRQVPCKIHAVRLEKDKTYQIDMVGHGIDAYLRLEDSAGKQLAEDDDSGGNLNARIRFAPTKTDLYLVIATTCGGGEGPYTLTVRNFKPAPQKILAMKAVEAKKPSELKGQLNATDPNDNSRNVPCKIHTIALKAGKDYTIDLISSEFDAYLRLEDPRGNNIQEDDDSGGDLNSRITYRPTADGEYRLVAMPLGGVRGQTGQYLLRVTEHEKK
jgi:hypothetical protein